MLPVSNYNTFDSSQWRHN